MPEHLEALQRVCAFDLIANNADRKGGHCLVADNAIYAIDNGLCFHVEPKLRTVIWDFTGQPVPEPALADLRRFVDAGGAARAPRSDEPRCAPARGRCCARGASATARGRAIPGRWCDVADAYRPYLPATDMPRFLRELAEFVGLTDADVAAIPGARRKCWPARPRSRRRLRALPESATARFFLGADGTPTRRIERRRHSLARWLRETAQAALTHEQGYYLLTIGLSHSHRAQGPGGVIPVHSRGDIWPSRRWPRPSEPRGAGGRPDQRGVEKLLLASRRTAARLPATPPS
jgi:hypothetical protein